MRILFLSTVYPKPHAPIRGVYCENLCRALAERHAVRVISPTPWTERFAQRPTAVRAKEGIVGEANLTELHPWYYYLPRVLLSRSDRFMWASIRSVVRRTIAEFRPDCVLSYWAHPDGAVAAQAARWADVPVGVIVGGSDVLLLPREASRRRAVVRALGAMDAVFVVNKDLKQWTTTLGVAETKVHVVLQGVDKKRFSPGDRTTARARLGLPESRQLLLWVGRMDPVKALDVLIEACSILRKGANDFLLLLVGEGPMRGPLKLLVDRLGLGEHVRFVGRVAYESLPDWYRAVDLTVLSSYSEGLPNVLRESLACGTPYVATNVGGVMELTDDPAIRLVPAANPDALAQAVAEVLAARLTLDPTRTQLFDWSQVADETARILHQLIDRHRSEHPVAAKLLTNGS